jgi:hypothetical protein
MVPGQAFQFAVANKTNPTIPHMKYISSIILDDDTAKSTHHRMGIGMAGVTTTVQPSIQCSKDTTGRSFHGPGIRRTVVIVQKSFYAGLSRLTARSGSTHSIGNNSSNTLENEGLAFRIANPQAILILGFPAGDTVLAGL